MSAIAPSAAPQTPRSVNGLGLMTLTLREIRRFLKVYVQTVLAPVATTLIFLAVFVLAMGDSMARTLVDGLPFPVFLAPGLIMMAMAQNAFANTSSSLVIAKIQGNIVDVLMAPLSAAELSIAYTLGGVVRGLVVGLAVSLAMLPFVPLQIHSIAAILFYAVMASAMLSLLGVAGGIWADKFDHIAAVTNFIVTPLSFLSGTFYSIERLPDSLRFLAHINPFFYMIDGFRFGFTGHADASLLSGGLLLAGCNLGLGWLVWSMFRSGYKLKA